MSSKFERLEIWQLAIEYVDKTYVIADQLPREEDFNLKSQLRRAATSIALNIAEGSTGQTDAEQARFLGYALRSLVETVACQHLIRRRAYQVDPIVLQTSYHQANVLARKIQSLRKSLDVPHQGYVRESTEMYAVEDDEA